MDKEELETLQRSLQFEFYRYAAAYHVNIARWRGIVDAEGNFLSQMKIHLKYITPNKETLQLLRKYYHLKAPKLDDYLFDAPRQRITIMGKPF